MIAAAKAPQIAKGLLQAAENAVAPRTLNPQTGAFVWHGSPHKFDRFDSSKIGTGEGARAYGHGLYLAESPDVADSYSRLFEGKKKITRLLFKDGQRISGTLKNYRNMVADDVVGNHGGNPAEALRVAIRDDADPEYIDAVKELLGKTITRKDYPREAYPPQLYKVDLPDPVIARMLDWDQPLSQQAPEVQKALPEFVNRGVPSANGVRKMTGEEIISELGLHHAERLRRAGIPGIRYLDGGSRGAGSGTSNFVVFPGEENILTILERNGIPLR